jgi:hypothetical protein
MFRGTKLSYYALYIFITSTFVKEHWKALCGSENGRRASRSAASCDELTSQIGRADWVYSERQIITYISIMDGSRPSITAAPGK